MQSIMFTRISDPEGWGYCSSVTMPENATEEEIKAAEDAQFIAWLSFVRNPPQPEPPPEEGL